MARSVGCLVGRHRWATTENRETQGLDLRCERCGTERHTYPGDPSFRPPSRGPDSHNGVANGGGGP